MQHSIIRRELKEARPRFNKEVQHLAWRPFGWYTGCLWKKDTGILALRSFEGNILRDFGNVNDIQWDDENTMLTLSRSG